MQSPQWDLGKRLGEWLLCVCVCVCVSQPLVGGWKGGELGVSKFLFFQEGAKGIPEVLQGHGRAAKLWCIPTDQNGGPSLT